MPPVNAFVTLEEKDHEEAFPLGLGFCRDCTLVQLTAHVPPEKLFSHYHHMSSASAQNRRHQTEVADLMFGRLRLGLKPQLLEIGSNDGTLLKELSSRGAQVLGVDPAENLAVLASQSGAATMTGFFDEEFARSLVRGGYAFDGIVALNVLAHTPTFMSMLRGIRMLLNPNAMFVMENAYVVETILQGQFDTIYHEHISNFSLHSLCAAFERAGLVALDVEIIPTQGTSIRVIVGRSDGSHDRHESVKSLLAKEKAKGFADPALFQGIAKKVDVVREKIKTWLHENRKHRIVAIGAPARGVVLLNACGITPESVSYVIDDTPLKQGKLTPGTHIEVAGWDRLPREPADRFLLLSWNYRDDLLSRLKQHKAGGRVLVPFPEFEEVTL